MLPIMRITATCGSVFSMKYPARKCSDIGAINPVEFLFQVVKAGNWSGAARFIGAVTAQ